MRTKTDLCQLTVIIPCFNREKYVGRSIESVILQTGVNTEIIVIDDGSTDNSKSEVKKFGERVEYVRIENSGACVARNVGLKLAKGDLVLFLDSDDFLEPLSLEALRYQLLHDEADIAIGEVIEKSDSGIVKRRELPTTNTLSEFMAEWLRGHFVPPCGILWRRDFCRSIGGWKEGLSKNQDGEIVLRAAVKGANITTAPNAKSVYWIHQGERLSDRFTEQQLRDQFEVLTWLRTASHQSEAISGSLERAFSVATHQLERLSMRLGMLDLGGEISHYRSFAGWSKAEGSVIHRMGVAVLGLHKKESLGRAIADWRSRLASER